MGSATYVTLVASLPTIGPMLAAREAPISQDRFAARLSMLTDEDRATLTRVADVLSWRRIPLGVSDAEFMANANAVMASLESHTLRDLVQKRLEMRTLVAALRRRHAGESAPQPGTAWGVAPLTRRIDAAWGEPTFRLERSYPWLTSARAAVEDEDAAGLERTLIETAWKQAAVLAAWHQFDFEAVALYAVRLNLLTRWTTYDGEIAGTRFAGLVNDAVTAAHDVLRDAGASEEART